MAETLRTIKELQTTHGAFLKKPIKKSMLDDVIRAAVRAANASARQSYSIIALRSAERVKSVCGYAGTAALVFCIDFSRLVDLSERIGSPWKPEGTQAFITGSTDTILAAQTACIAASDMGLGTLFTNSLHRRPLDDVFEDLNLPEQYCFPLITLVLGYPRRKTTKLRGRISGPGVVHADVYRRLDAEEMDAMVAQYDKPASRLATSQGWRKNGFDHYLNWFFEDWCAMVEPSGKRDAAHSKLIEVGLLPE
jgi:FMN reductase [NAD(P)H]